MKISIKERNIIRPAKETPKRNLWVSDLDIVVSEKHNSLVCFFKQQPNKKNSNFFEAKVLKDALSEVLVAFYPLAGRLGRDENGRTHINCNGDGVLFIEAETTSVIDDFGDFTPSDDTSQLVPSFDYSLDPSAHPLFAVQLTRLRCGSVCLGICVHKTVADGTSGGQFTNSWSDVARGEPIAIKPFLDRTILEARGPPAPLFHHMEYDPRPTMMQTPSSKAISTKTLKITPNQLATLKAKLRNATTGIHYTTHEILSAHIWYCVCKARDLPNDQVTNLYMPTNGRSRFIPPLPSGFFGNVLFSTTVSCSVSEIQSRPLEETMAKIRLSLKKMDDTYLRSAIDYLKTQPDLTVLKTTNAFNSPNLDIVNWTKVPFYGMDFGWGKPIHVGRAVISFEGLAFITSNPNNEGSLAVVICLQVDHMERFCSIFNDLLISKGHSKL